MRKTDELQQRFQQANSLDELNECNDCRYYKRIHIKFLEMLFGEDWEEVFQGAYGDDTVDFINDYIYDYEEWLGFWNGK